MHINKIQNNMNQNFCGFKVNKCAISQLREDSLYELLRMKEVFANSKYIDVDIKQRPSWKSPDPVVSFRIKKLPANVTCNGNLNCDISEIEIREGSIESVRLNREMSLVGLEPERPNKSGAYKLTPGGSFWETMDRIEALEQAFQKKAKSNKILNKFA